MLERVIERVRLSNVDKVVVASPEIFSCSIPVFIGDEFDVLKRFYDCASHYWADTIVRITADCPLIDPKIINSAIDYYNNTGFPYVYFAPVDGLDVEVFSYELLKEAHEKATLPDDREHVTPYMKRATKISVDTMEELERVRKIYGMER